MKQVYRNWGLGLILLSGCLICSTATQAKTEKTKVIKAARPGDAKMAKDPNFKMVPGNDKPANPSEDSAGAPPNSIFYEPKNKRNINIQDIYVGLGGGYLQSRGSSNAPFRNAVTLNANYGIPLLNKYLILEFSNNADFMYAPDLNWFSKAFALQKSDIKGINVGFNDEFTMGLHLVIAGSRKFTITAGPLVGGKLTMLPSTHFNGSLYNVNTPIAFCYGAKAKMFVGKYFYCFAEYSNTTTTSVAGYVSQSEPDARQKVRYTPVDFGMLRFGAGYILKPWW